MNKITNFLCLSLLLLGASALGMDHPDNELIEAAKSGDARGVERLIDRGASVQAKTIIGWTPLIWAAARGHMDVCRLLIENKAIVDAKDLYDGDTSLHRAALCGHGNVCRLLIENKASIEARNNQGDTPLISAGLSGYEAVCRILIENKALVEARNKRGWSSLMCAARKCREDACKPLIDVQLELARNNKAAIETFLGIVSKRSKNLPCEMQRDIAIMIARQVFEAVKRDRRLVIDQINASDNLEVKKRLLEHVNRQMNLPITFLKPEQANNKKHKSAE